MASLLPHILNSPKKPGSIVLEIIQDESGNVIARASDDEMLLKLFLEEEIGQTSRNGYEVIKGIRAAVESNLPYEFVGNAYSLDLSGDSIEISFLFDETVPILKIPISTFLQVLVYWLSLLKP